MVFFKKLMLINEGCIAMVMIVMPFSFSAAPLHKWIDEDKLTASVYSLGSSASEWTEASTVLEDSSSYGDDGVVELEGAGDGSPMFLQTFIQQFTKESPAFNALLDKEESLLNAYRSWIRHIPASLLVDPIKKQEDKFYSRLQTFLQRLPTKQLTFDPPAGFATEYDSISQLLYGKMVLHIYSMYLTSLLFWMNKLTTPHLEHSFFGKVQEPMLTDVAKHCVQLIMKECCRFGNLLVLFTQQYQTIKHAFDVQASVYALLNHDGSIKRRVDPLFVQQKSIYVGKSLLLSAMEVMTTKQTDYKTQSPLQILYKITEALGRSVEYRDAANSMHNLITIAYSSQEPEDLAFLADILSRVHARNFVHILQEYHRAIADKMKAIDVVPLDIVDSPFDEDGLFDLKQAIIERCRMLVSSRPIAYSMKRGLAPLTLALNNLMGAIAPIITPKNLQLDALVFACYLTLYADLQAYKNALKNEKVHVSKKDRVAFDAAIKENLKIKKLYETMHAQMRAERVGGSALESVTKTSASAESKEEAH